MAEQRSSLQRLGMAEIRDGERRRRSRRRRYRPYHRSTDVWHSEGYSISSDTEVVDNGRRNTDLEDALFGLFRNKRIPKEIASVLDIPEKGKANLIFGYDWNICEASYYTCKDERICFRAGWPQFAAQHKIGDGSVLLILFHKDNGDRLCVSFDRL